MRRVREFIAPGGGGGGSVTYTALLTQNLATTNLTTTPVVITGLGVYDEIILSSTRSRHLAT